MTKKNHIFPCFVLEVLYNQVVQAHIIGSKDIIMYVAITIFWQVDTSTKKIIVNISMAIYMGLYHIFLARFARSVFKTIKGLRHKHKSIQLVY